MATYLDSGSSDEEFEGFPCQANQAAKKRKRKLVNNALESTEDDDDDDSDDFKGAVKSSGRKRKVLEAFESDEDDSSSEEDDASSNDDDDDDDDDDDTDDEEEEDCIEAEDTLDVDLNEEVDVPSNSDQCPICLMSLGGQKLGTPSECQHVFCLACIMEWSKNANTCPVDRKVFRQILVHSTKKGPILERIRVEDRQVPEIGWEQEPTFCEVCNECDREDRMLLCDGCDKGYHLECLRPRLYTVPAGSWYCATCLEIRRNEQLEEEGESLPELLPGNVRRSRGTARAATRSGTSSETSSELDGPQRARTAATSRRRSSSSTRGRGRGRGRTGSRSSTRGRSRSRTTGRSRTGSSTRRGRGGKKKTRKRTGRSSSTTGKPKRKKRKTNTTKRKRRTTTKSKAKKRKVDNEDSYRNPFEGQSFRGRTPKERLNNSLRASGSSSDTGRGLGMSAGLSIFGDQFALDGFEDDSTNEPEQSDSASSVKSGNSDVLGSIFDGIETLHDQNATVSRYGRVLPSESPGKQSPNKGSQIKATESSSNQNPGNLSREGSDVISPTRDRKQREGEKPGDSSYEEAKCISRDQNDSHVTSVKANESHQSNDRSRDGASFTTFSRDQTGHKVETTGSPPLVKDDKETTKTRENNQTGLQSVASGLNKLHDKASVSTEQAEGATSENRLFREISRNDSSAIANLQKTSTPPKLKNEKSSKVPSPARAHSSSSGSSSKKSLKQPTPSSSKKHVRFKIPKKSSHSPDSSFSRESPSPRNLPSKSPSPQDSKMSNSVGVSDSSVSRTLPVSFTSNSSPQDSKVSHSIGVSDSSVSKTLPVSFPSNSTPQDSKMSHSIGVSDSSVSKTLPVSFTSNSPPQDSKMSHSVSVSNSSVSRTPPVSFTSNSPQDSKMSLPSSISDSPASKTTTSNSNDSSLYKRVSPIVRREEPPIVWAEENSERKKLPEFKVDDNASRTNSSTVCPKALSPKIPPNVQKNNELNSLEDKINMSSDFKKGSSSSARDFEEKHENKSNFGGAKSDLGSVNKDSSHQSAFSPISKTKESSESSDVKKEELKMIPTAEVTGETSLLGNQNPSLYGKPSLQQLPPSFRSSSPSSKSLGHRPSISSLPGSIITDLSGKTEKRRSLSPSLSKLLGPRPSTTSMTGCASTSLSGKTEKQSPLGQDARVIEFSREKGELKIKVVPSQDEAHPAFRSLPEEAHPTLRSLPPSIDPPLPTLNTVQPLSSLRPLKTGARPPTRPKLKMLSTPEISQPASGTLTSGVQPSRDFPNRTNQNLAIIQMLRHKTSSLRSEVEKEHSLLREELELSRRETPENEPESLSKSISISGSSTRLPIEGSMDQHENNINRPKLSSLLGLPRNSNVPVAVVRPSLSSVNKNSNLVPGFHQSVSFAGFADSGPQDLESERERNRKKGIARLQRIERIKNAVKAALQPYYNHNEISRQDFKEIFTRAVDKVEDSKHEVDRHRIAALVKKYVKMFKGLRLIATNQKSNL